MAILRMTFYATYVYIQSIYVYILMCYIDKVLEKDVKEALPYFQEFIMFLTKLQLNLGNEDFALDSTLASQQCRDIIISGLMECKYG